MNTGFIKVSAVSPRVTVANVEKNLQNALKTVKAESESGSSLIVFPELYLTAYTCGDLFLQDALIQSALDALIKFSKETAYSDAVICIGLPLRVSGRLYNCAAVLQSGAILGIVPKTYIPNYNEYYEKRWFASSEKVNCSSVIIDDEEVPFGSNLLFTLSSGAVLGVEICEDLWVPVPPSSELCLNGADIIANLSASNEAVTKNDYRKNIISVQSAKCFCAYVYASSGVGESSTDLVFSGACTIAENGAILSESERFAFDGSSASAYIDFEKLNSERVRNGSFSDNNEILRENDFTVIPAYVNEAEYDDIARSFYPYPFVPSNESERELRCGEILSIQSAGLAKRLAHTGLKKAVIGISGGLDSTLALLVAVKAMEMLSLPNENIICVTMPGFGTTDMTYNNAVELIKALNTTFKEIDIKPACLRHMSDIGHDSDIHDITYENTQARERTQILMDISNKVGGILVGTGDLSELALGWCTYNADHMSMYGVNCSVPKTLVRHLVRFEAEKLGGEIEQILLRVLETPVSPELLPPDENGNIKQKTEDKLGPYEVHDFYLYYFLRFGTKPQKLLFMASRAFSGKYSEEQLKEWLRLFIKRFFISQFKRSCLPDGPKVGSVSLSPRGDFRMPSDAEFTEWLKF